MFDVQTLADHIGLALPQSWVNCAAAAWKTYDPMWMERFDFETILAFYGLDEDFSRRVYAELDEIRQDEKLKQACWLMRYILLDAPPQDYYDIWNWDGVRWSSGSPMVPAVVLLTGQQAHLDWAKKRSLTQEQLDRQRFALGRTCMSERDKFGVEGIRFSRMIWNSLHIKGTLMNIGRLEYELDLKDYPVLDACFAEKPVYVHIHIGGGRSLEPAEVDASLAQARAELPGYYPELEGKKLVFMTESWLLSPELKQMLSPGSNILHFQDRFTLVEHRPAVADWLNFLYGIADPAYPPEQLPQDTSLRRVVRQRLMEGQILHASLGYIRE